MNLEEQIALLNPQPGERFSASYKKEGMQKPKSVVLPPELIPSYVDKLPLDADIWIGINPVDHTKVVTGGRGTSRDVTRLAALPIDLDVKEGGCSSYGQAMEIIYSLADILGEEPTMIIHSGHGVQPYWAVDPDENWPNPKLAALLTRWGALVRIVAKSVGAEVDSIFDLSRILRAVGTLNNKRLHIDGFAVEVTGDLGTGGPMALSQIADRLDEYGVPDVEPGSEDDFTGQSDPAAWGFAPTTCGYAKAAIEGWRTDAPTRGRHPWMHGNAIRLEAFRRNGCLTGEGYRQAVASLKGRFEELCANGIGGDARAAKPAEVDGSLKDARAYVALMSDSRLLGEVSHLHDIVENPVVSPSPRATNSGAAQAKPGGNTDPEEDHPEPTPDELHRNIFEAEGENFWCATDALKMIYEASLAHMVSPWAVLTYSVARVLQLMPPTVELPNLVGKRGSLNWFAIVADKSGGGKSAAASVAEDVVSLVFPQEINEEPIGSGEGMIKKFFMPDPNDKKILIRRDAVMFTSDEIDDLTAMSQRQGGTTLPMIRTAFTGGTLGHSYVTQGRDLKVMASTYRMTLVVNAQPGRCGALLDDSAGGTPQRFMWFPANDRRPSIGTADENHLTPGVGLPTGLALLGRKRIQVPAEARKLSLEIRQAQLHGDMESELDGHANFARLKFAAALAMLDGRTDMSEEDWRLSGVAAEVSSRTRRWVQAELAHSLESEARDVGRIRGIGYAAADHSKHAETAKKARGVQNWILNKLKVKGPMTLGALRRDAHSDDREMISNCLDALESSSLIERDADGKRWVAL